MGAAVTFFMGNAVDTEVIFGVVDGGGFGTAVGPTVGDPALTGEAVAGTMGITVMGDEVGDKFGGGVGSRVGFIAGALVGVGVGNGLGEADHLVVWDFPHSRAWVWAMPTTWWAWVFAEEHPSHR